jgi:hypothetical protein
VGRERIEHSKQGFQSREGRDTRQRQPECPNEIGANGWRRWRELGRVGVSARTHLGQQSAFNGAPKRVHKQSAAPPSDFPLRHPEDFRNPAKGFPQVGSNTQMGLIQYEEAILAVPVVLQDSPKRQNTLVQRG